MFIPVGNSTFHKTMTQVHAILTFSHMAKNIFIKVLFFLRTIWVVPTGKIYWYYIDTLLNYKLYNMSMSFMSLKLYVFDI